MSQFKNDQINNNNFRKYSNYDHKKINENNNILFDFETINVKLENDHEEIINKNNSSDVIQKNELNLLSQKP